jgi:hypothetical protein
VAAGRVLTVTAIAALIGGILRLSGILVSIELNHDSPTAPDVEVPVALCVFAFVAAPVGSRLSWLGQILYQRNAKEILARGEYVLFLRSFELDACRFRVEPRYPRFLRSFLEDGTLDIGLSFLYRLLVRPTTEEPLVAAFGKIAPIIAVGRPNEPLPTLGASRLYVEENDWPYRVAELIHDAKLILCVLGSSPGLVREMKMALNSAALHKLVFYVPVRGRFMELVRGSHKPYHLDFDRWAFVCDAIQPLLPVKLPQQPMRDTFIFFRREETGWRCHTVQAESVADSSIRQLSDFANRGAATVMGAAEDAARPSVLRKLLVMALYIGVSTTLYFSIPIVFRDCAGSPEVTCMIKDAATEVITILWILTMGVVVIWGYEGRLWGARRRVLIPTTGTGSQRALQRTDGNSAALG